MEITVLQINESLFLEQILQFEVNKKISSIQLNDQEISIIEFLVKQSPDSLLSIKTCILEIIKDEKIDASDIPQFIQLIKSLYTLLHTKNQIKINDISSAIGSIIKYVVHIALDKYDIKNPQLIICCDSLVNVCVEMIDLQSSLITKTCFFKFC